MRKLTSCVFISLNGFYKDENNTTNWYKHGTEEQEFSVENLKNNEHICFLDALLMK